MVSPLIAAVASLIIPGLGQALAGDLVRGIITFVAVGTVVLLMFLSVILIVAIPFVEPILHIIAAYDAYKLADSGEGII